MKHIKNISVYIVGLFFVIFSAFPLLWGISTSLKNKNELIEVKLIELTSRIIIILEEYSLIKKELYSFLKDHHQLTQTDLMMEIFLQLSLVKESDFLSKDATVVMMEVNRHAIHQI